MLLIFCADVSDFVIMLVMTISLLCFYCDYFKASIVEQYTHLINKTIIIVGFVHVLIFLNLFYHLFPAIQLV